MTYLHNDADTTIAHHPECDGLRFHAMFVRHDGPRVLYGECGSCDYATGRAGSEDTVKAMWDGRAQHSVGHPAHDGLCHGECEAWD